jgi:hypothetical protein
MPESFAQEVMNAWRGVAVTDPDADGATRFARLAGTTLVEAAAVEAELSTPAPINITIAVANRLDG